MAFNGTGTFVRIYNWVSDKINLVPITASRMDAEMDDIATGLSNCITKDGQTTITANIPMNSHKFTGLSTGNARTDSLTLGQVQDGQFTALGLTGGAADAYTASPSPAITAYVPTMEYSAKIHATNLTTNPTLLISAISGGTIKKLDASKAEIAVEASDMLAGGFYNFKRNVANDAWILLNPEKSFINLANANGYAVAATESVAGIAEIATASEAKSFTDDLRMITPLKLSNAIGQIAIFQDQKANGTVGGSASIGGVQTRTLNTTVFNAISGASLGSNQITLPAGTYSIVAQAPGYATANTKAYFYNVTDSSDAIFGTNAFGLSTGGYCNSFVNGIITIASAKVFELRQYTQINDGSTSSLGKPTNFSATLEYYSTVNIIKLA